MKAEGQGNKMPYIFVKQKRKFSVMPEDPERFCRLKLSELSEFLDQ